MLPPLRTSTGSLPQARADRLARQAERGQRRVEHGRLADAVPRQGQLGARRRRLADQRLGDVADLLGVLPGRQADRDHARVRCPEGSCGRCAASPLAMPLRSKLGSDHVRS